MPGPLLASGPEDVSQRERGCFRWNARGVVSGGAVRKRQGGGHTEPQAWLGRWVDGASGSPLRGVNARTGEWSPQDLSRSRDSPCGCRTHWAAEPIAEDAVGAGCRDRREACGSRGQRAGGPLGMQRRENVRLTGSLT